MIENLDDALEFYAGREKEFSLFGAPVLRRRSEAIDDLDDVARELGLPESYVRCAKDLYMEGVSLGFFELCPGDPRDLCRSLLDFNSSMSNSILPQDLLHVANFDADIIAVPKGAPFHRMSTVYFVDITTSERAKINAISNSFSDFIVLASALYEAVLEDRSDPEGILCRLLLKLGCESYAGQWRRIASMA
ncbi:MAG: hypothetical protein Q4G36_08965 [Paracoccus sp. (in: a-proteobacteria)]|nr:hypothetical protein [Paracoccus sp. (in: a-proteobacteria)]